MSPIEGAAIGAAVGATAVTAARWLRVAQREHYLVGSVTPFLWRWLRSGRVGPAVRGRTSKLAWTRRLKTLAVVWLIVHVVVVALLALVVPLWLAVALAAVALPLVLDAALAVTTPLERRLATPYVERASARLREIRPTVVGITGSYGKTSTKVVLAHLLGATRSTYATPASFNNRAGLARAVNEGLNPGTEVFVAEMGTYGKGEIAELCAWCAPEIAIITAIGPVHLERFGTEDAIVEAKSEILEGARVAILNVDDERLSALAARREGAGQRVVRVSSRDQNADVAVIAADDRRARVWISGDDMGEVDPLTAAAGNAACALAAAVELGASRTEAVRRLATAPVAAHRLVAATSDAGIVVLDDTFNSNPAGARRALSVLRSHAAVAARRVVITPGMIELGPRSRGENAAFAAAAGEVADVLVIVGSTNRKALTGGAQRAGLETVHVPTREAAVAWVRANLTNGDAVLYENDLPDHYP